MHKIRSKIFVVALIGVFSALIQPFTLAYYQTIGTATNVITSGNIRLIVHETTDQGTPFPKDGVYVVPGDVVSKQVRIENDCAHPFYLRVKVTYGNSVAELPADNCFRLNINEEYWTLHDGWYYYQGVVEPHTITPYVFSQVEVVGAEVDNRHLGAALELTVVAHAVQSENNPLQNGAVHTALGWPAG